MSSSSSLSSSGGWPRCRSSLWLSAPMRRRNSRLSSSSALGSGGGPSPSARARMGVLGRTPRAPPPPRPGGPPRVGGAPHPRPGALGPPPQERGEGLERTAAEGEFSRPFKQSDFDLGKSMRLGHNGLGLV